ncbi:pentatricopeptide repeat-containing protein [Canna indica]|uniref:Pentatricopeptide repeat-containing protein n=1 Tax=Canna indica TaxID=4628 RepID=A0AAQ3K4A2_9LILI|nr:pentatricopeptide repeat-containing protein [Canna indica]
MAGLTAKARELFHEMPSWNIVSCTTMMTMISGYAQNLQVDVARKLFEVMKKTLKTTHGVHSGGVQKFDELKLGLCLPSTNV